VTANIIIDLKFPEARHRSLRQAGIDADICQ